MRTITRRRGGEAHTRPGQGIRSALVMALHIMPGALEKPSHAFNLQPDRSTCQHTATSATLNTPDTATESQIGPSA
jgi:hypothetical protein